MEKVQQQRIHKHYLLLKTKRNDISWVVRINHCHLVRIMRIISTFIQNLLYHSHLTCIWADHHVGTRSRRWWQSDSEEKTRKHCSKPLELFKETFSSHVSGNKTAHFWLHIWTFYCCVGGKNKAGYFCKMLGHFPIFDETSTHLPAVSLPEKNGHFWWDDGKTPDFFGTRCHNFRAMIVTTPHPRQSKSIAVASCTMKKCKVSIHLLVVASYIPQSRATEDMHSWYIGEYRIGNWIRIWF